MTKVSTGETVEFNETVDSEDPEQLIEFMWGDGNYSCDCNRHIFFNRDGLGMEYNNFEAVQCGDGMYKVKITTSDTNKVIYEDKQ